MRALGTWPQYHKERLYLFILIGKYFCITIERKGKILSFEYFKTWVPKSADAAYKQALGPDGFFLFFGITEFENRNSYQ